MPIDRSIQPIVKDSKSILAGVAQVRLANYTSVRAAGARLKPLNFIPAGMSTVAGSTPETVLPTVPYTANSSSSVITLGGTYSGLCDGCFILRITGATTASIYRPDGERTAVTALAPINVTVQGVSFKGTLEGTAVGDTWVVPVVSAQAQNSSQTGIVSPYSMFSGAANSVGLLRDASWDTKVTTVELQEAGVSSQVHGQLVTKVTTTLNFTAYEYAGPSGIILRDMAYALTQKGVYQAVAAEVVCRTRGGGLVTYWCPSCTLADAPTVSPQNDFSSISWSLRVNSPSAVGQTGSYAAWLRNTPQYYELQYPH